LCSLAPLRAPPTGGGFPAIAVLRVGCELLDRSGGWRERPRPRLLDHVQKTRAARLKNAEIV
jgi:hypothetical protein